MSDNFDDHINKSIRNYDQLRDDIVSLSKYFVTSNSNVVDYGCSQGTMIKRIRDTNKKHAKKSVYYGVDINDDFRKHWKNEEDLKYQIADIRPWMGDIEDTDPDDEFADWVSYTDCSLIISMFTMQFINESDRLRVLDEIYNIQLNKGGALILCEKVFSPDAKFQNMMDSLYLDYKRQFFSEKELVDKEQELRHLAKLQTEETIMQNLKSIGFSDIQMFWRNFNFIGLVAIK
jgi:tRNA (cmo5U34)-methyltransferase